MPVIICLNCGKIKMMKKPEAIYCSHYCNVLAHQKRLKLREEREKRHPSMEDIIRVLKHLNSMWKKEATVSYVLEVYEKTKKDQEKDHKKHNEKTKRKSK